LPGTTVHGPINPDGFYMVSGNIWSDSTFIMNFAVPTPIKYTERGNGTPIVTTSRIGGPNSFIQWHIQAPGDLYVGETVNSRTFCGVPPPPF
jgi:hypothetical protein